TITWKIGGKGTSFQYDGIINNDQFKNSGAKAAIIKTGSGRWTLTNGSTYSGGTVIERGTIVAANSYGSATGLGAVEVSSNASLAGTGIIQGAVTISNRGYIMPGLSSDIGNLTIKNNVTFMDGARFYIKADANTLSCDKITATGTVSLAGTLYMNLSAGSFAPGQSYKIINASTIVGDFSAISPATPGAGLYWDLSLLRTNGIVKVSDSPTSIHNYTSHSFKLYPNPSTGTVTLNLPDGVVAGTVLICIDDIIGGTVFNAELSLEDDNLLNLSELKKGIYIVTVTINSQRYRSKLILE
ncbi:MAG: T9SS type A sorting domain-containing protein, partial [Cyclobacteriaceae bacterium]